MSEQQAVHDWIRKAVAINDVVPYGGRAARPGLTLLQAPGNDQVSTTALVAAGANEIEAVDFDVIGKGDMRAAARRQAVAAARRKAELYADAAGIRLGPVIHIEDVDPERVGAERYRGHGSGGAAAAEDLAPGHVVVSAAVVLGLSITHD